MAAALAAHDMPPVHEAFLDTITVRTPGRADELITAAAAAGVDLGTVDADHLRIACDETTTHEHLVRVLTAFGVSDPAGALAEAAAGLVGELSPALPAAVPRQGAFLTHPVFHRHRTETSMLRFLRRLADADYALDRGMIPLGSCTMKLNATTEMEAVSWPEFADVHPLRSGCHASRARCASSLTSSAGSPR
jgi:glycine dehydrogenase